MKVGKEGEKRKRMEKKPCSKEMWRRETGYCYQLFILNKIPINI
jgi:hypothetical protein